MQSPKRLKVPLCDIMAYVQDGFKENISEESRVVSRKRTLQQKREKKELAKSIQTKKRKKQLQLKKESESETDSEEDDSFKQNQESENEIDSEKDSSFKENQKESEINYEEDSSFKESQKTEISEFERMVQKNREERIAFLQSLKMNEVKEEFIKSVENITPKPKPKKKSITFKRHKAAAVMPSRFSRRLAKMDVNDLSEEALFKKAVEQVTSKTEIKFNDRKSKKIHGSPPIMKLEYNKSSNIYHSQDVKELPAIYPFEEAISVRDDFSEFITNFDFTVEDNIKFNTNYATNFKHMKLGESGVAKIVPTRITSLAIHPSADKIIVIAGSKNGHLGFWNVTSSLQPIVFLPHTGGITNLKVNPNNPLQIISSSYDGTLRCGDMVKNSFNQIYNVSDETACTYFDFVSATTLLVSQRNGNISIIDVRDESLKSEKKHECHDYAIKTVQCHPGNKNLFLTAENKGSIKLWDLRKLQKNSIIDVCHHKRSVSSAFFSPATGKNILTTSADDSLCIFDSSALEKEILFKKSIKHNNHTGRWLTPFKATWLPNSDELFSVGSMNYPRRIEIFNANGHNVFNFTNDEYLNSVTSANEFHPSLNVLAGGNSSGKVFIFSDTQLN